MAPFSFDLTHGYIEFASRAVAEDDRRLRRAYNAAAVVFSVATIEAVLNERISLTINIFSTDEEEPVVAALAAMQRTLGLKDKWNLLAATRRSRPWNSGIEPFQSWDVLIALRNEILHFKAQFLQHRETPVLRLRSLLRVLEVDADPEQDDVSYWLEAALGSRKLGPWITEKVQYADILALLDPIGTPEAEAEKSALLKAWKDSTRAL